MIKRWMCSYLLACDAPQEVTIKALVLDASPITHIDMSGCRELDKLRRALSNRGTRLVIGHCRYECHRKMQEMGLFEPFEDTAKFDVVCFRDLHTAVLFAEDRLKTPMGCEIRSIDDETPAENFSRCVSADSISTRRS